MSEKLQKVLARAGLGSRRQLERWIEQGRVSVDGCIAQLGDRVTQEQVLKVDGKAISVLPSNRPRLLLYHKPEGEICSRDDPGGRTTVFSKLPAIDSGRWIVIGRLDINTSGLLIFTDDGELANRLMHPRYEFKRIYAVRVFGLVADSDLEQLQNGVMLADGLARFHFIEDVGGEGANHWYRVGLAEGRNREVRRMWEVVGVQVSRLIRVSFGPIELPKNLRPGQSRQLGREEIERLLKLVGMDTVGDNGSGVKRPPKRGVGRRRDGN